VHAENPSKTVFKPHIGKMYLSNSINFFYLRPKECVLSNVVLINFEETQHFAACAFALNLHRQFKKRGSSSSFEF